MLAWPAPSLMGSSCTNIPRIQSQLCLGRDQASAPAFLDPPPKSGTAAPGTPAAGWGSNPNSAFPEVGHWNGWKGRGGAGRGRGQGCGKGACGGGEEGEESGLKGHLQVPALPAPLTLPALLPTVPLNSAHILSPGFQGPQPLSYLIHLTRRYPWLAVPRRR